MKNYPTHREQWSHIERNEVRVDTENIFAFLNIFRFFPLHKSHRIITNTRLISRISESTPAYHCTRMPVEYPLSDNHKDNVVQISVCAAAMEFRNAISEKWSGFLINKKRCKQPREIPLMKPSMNGPATESMEISIQKKYFAEMLPKFRGRNLTPMKINAIFIQV